MLIRSLIMLRRCDAVQGIGAGQAFGSRADVRAGDFVILARRTTAFPHHDIRVRGRDAPLTVRVIKEAEALVAEMA
jgi:hypothetical protein